MENKKVVVLNTNTFNDVIEDLDFLQKLLDDMIVDLHQVKGGAQPRHAFMLYRQSIWDVLAKLKQAKPIDTRKEMDGVKELLMSYTNHLKKQGTMKAGQSEVKLVDKYLDKTQTWEQAKQMVKDVHLQKAIDITNEYYEYYNQTFKQQEE